MSRVFMSEQRKELNSEIRNLFSNIQSALEEKDMEKARALTRVLDSIPKDAVARALNPVDPDIRNALLEQIKVLVQKFYNCAIQPAVFVKDVKVLVELGSLEPEIVKPLLKPVIIMMIKNSEKDKSSKI